MFTYKVSEIEFANGKVIETHNANVVLIVGPNNSGKSRALQEIGDTIEQSNHDKLVTRDITLQETGTLNDMIEWLSNYYSIIEPDNKQLRPYVNLNRSTDIKNRVVVRGHVSDFRRGIEILRKSKVMSRRLTDASWINMAFQASSINIYRDPPTHPIHILQKSQEIRESFSQVIFDAFLFHVTPELPFGSESTMQLKKGKEPQNIVNKYSLEFIEATTSLPNIKKEGSGVRAYIGILQHTIIGQHKIFLIDEPELFLHPPQAKRLGEVVAKHARINGQQIIAVTHSSDFVIGAVTGSDNVCIIRIDREGDTNHVTSIKPSDLAELWNDPLLKSARALRGLFHEGVIVCEGDSDIRFYEAILRRLEGKRNAPSDVHFVHGGGKDKIKFLVDAYKKLNVPVVAISDFDLIRNENTLKTLYEIMGGNFAEIQGLYNSAMNVLSQAGSVKSPKDAIAEIRQILLTLEDKVNKGGSISGSDADSIKISKLMEDAREWSNAKKLGLRSLESGAKKSVKDLFAELENLGLFIVNYGELESWNTDIVYKNKKSDWLNQALELIKDDESTFSEAEEFVEKVIKKLSNTHFA